MVADEADLGVERGVLREMADRVVRLGTEDGADLEDALEDPDEHLLVQLRTLREVGRATEVVKGEDVRAGLGRRADELGRRDLGEVESDQRRTESAHRGTRDLPGRPMPGMAQRHGCVVEHRRQARAEGRPPQLCRGRDRRLGERLDGRCDELGASRRGCVVVHGAGHRDDGLLRQLLELLEDLRLADHHLGQA
jgi:hypothetical protein